MAATSIRFKEVDLVCKLQRGGVTPSGKTGGLVWPEPIDPPLPAKQSTEAEKSTSVRPTSPLLSVSSLSCTLVIATGLVLVMALVLLLSRTSQADAELALQVEIRPRPCPKHRRRLAPRSTEAVPAAEPRRSCPCGWHDRRHAARFRCSFPSPARSSL